MPTQNDGCPLNKNANYYACPNPNQSQLINCISVKHCELNDMGVITSQGRVKWCKDSFQTQWKLSFHLDGPIYSKDTLEIMMSRPIISNFLKTLTFSHWLYDRQNIVEVKATLDYKRLVYELTKFCRPHQSFLDYNRIKKFKIFPKTFVLLKHFIINFQFNLSHAN